MEQLFSLADKIATPLSLAALVVLVLYSLFRLIIERLNLRSVLKADVYRLLMRAMTYVFVLAISALVLGLLSYLLTTLDRSQRTDAFLRDLGNSSVVRRITAIDALAQIARLDNSNGQRICDSMAALVRQASETSLQNGLAPEERLPRLIG